MKRCKNCLAKAEPENDLCPVCGIGLNKKKSDLSDVETKTRRAARNIRGVALLHLILSIAGVGSLLVARAWNQIPEHFMVQMAILLSCYSILIITAFGLSQYRYWAYKTATAFYFLMGIMFTISVQIPGILIMLILLYFIGNGRAKAIFERRAL